MVAYTNRTAHPCILDQVCVARGADEAITGGGAIPALAVHRVDFVTPWEQQGVFSCSQHMHRHPMQLPVGIYHSNAPGHERLDHM